MARIRSIKPELRVSLTVAEWPREVRYAWVLLWGYLDDYGRGVNDIRLIVADLFPLDRDVTERKMTTWLNLMAKQPADPDELPPLCRYEVGGRAYLHATKWHLHQKPQHPTPSRIPPCPHHSAAGTTPETPPNGSGPSHEKRMNGARAATDGFSASRTRAEQGAGSREREGERASAPPEISTTPTAKPARPRCPQHAHLPDDDPGPNCQRCAQARHELEAVQALIALDAADQRRRRTAEQRNAIAECGLCDLDGWRDMPGGAVARCDHQLVEATA